MFETVRTVVGVLKSRTSQNTAACTRAPHINFLIVTPHSQAGAQFLFLSIRIPDHAHRSHHFISDARHVATTCQCPVYLTIVSSRHGIVQHLSNRQRCLDTLRIVYEPMSHEDCKAMDQTALLAVGSNSVKAPARRAFGPRIDLSTPCVPRRIIF